MNENEEIAAADYDSDLKAERQETPHKILKPALAFEEGAVFRIDNRAFKYSDDPGACVRIFYGVGNEGGTDEKLEADFLFLGLGFFLGFGGDNLGL